MSAKVILPQARQGWFVSGSAELRSLDWSYPASTDVHLYILANTAADARAAAETRVCKEHHICPTWDYFEWTHDPFIKEATPIIRRPIT